MTTDPKVTNPPDFEESCLFLDGLALASQRCGVSGRPMVELLGRIAPRLGLSVQTLATPHYVQMVLTDSGGRRQRVELIVLRSGSYDLARLERVLQLADRVAEGSLHPAEGLARLVEIGRAPETYHGTANVLAYVLAGVAFGVILETSWLAAWLGGLAAVATYGMQVASARVKRIAPLNELLSAMIAAFLGQVAATVFPGVNPAAVTVCAVIVLVPGFGLTIAPNELMLGNTLSGLIGLTDAVVAAIKLFGGAMLGISLAHSAGLRPPAGGPTGDISTIWTWLAVPVLILSLGVLMKVDRRHFLSIVLGGWLVWTAVQTGKPLGDWQGTFLGAAVLLIYSNWFSRRFRMPSVVVILPCVMVLVPGLAALRAISVVESEGVVAGLQATYRILIIIFAIIGGALVGDTLSLHRIASGGRAVGSLIGWPLRTLRRRGNRPA